MVCTVGFCHRILSSRLSTLLTSGGPGFSSESRLPETSSFCIVLLLPTMSGAVSSVTVLSTGGFNLLSFHFQNLGIYIRVLKFLQFEVFEPLQERDFKFLSGKTGLLWALPSTPHGSELGGPGLVGLRS